MNRDRSDYLLPFPFLSLTCSRRTLATQPPVASAPQSLKSTLFRLENLGEMFLTVRPGAAGLLIGLECSRVRDITWMYLTSLVTTRIGVELAVVQGNYPTVL